MTGKRAVAIGEAMVEFAPLGDGTYRKGFAGDTFNTVWHMAQLLAGRAEVGYVTRVGQDRLSDAFVAELGSDGLDASGIGRDAARTMGLYLIELDGAERSFLYWRDHSAARALADEPEALAAAVAGAGLIHLSGITLAILAPAAREALLVTLDRARAAGARVCFDPNHRPRLWASPQEARDWGARMLALTDIALPSFDDEAALWGDGTPAVTLQRLREAGVGEAAVKDGAGPVWFMSGAGTGSRDTPPVATIVDTTGAGDAFNAGYLAARQMGLEPERALAAGQGLSAQVIGVRGARLPRDKARGLAGLVA